MFSMDTFHLCSRPDLILKKPEYTLFISNTFLSNVKLKLAKYQPKAKQHPEAELLLSENYSFFHQRYRPKIVGDILKNVQK